MNIADQKPRVLAKSRPDMAAGMTILLSLGLWDQMSINERRAFCEDGEVWDTPCGRRLFSIIREFQPSGSGP